MDLLVTHCDATMADCAVLFLRSLARCSDCVPVLFHHNISPKVLPELEAAHPKIRLYPLTDGEFVGRIATSKVECVQEVAQNIAKQGDFIIASDVDMLVKDDPFDLFDLMADVYVTKRGTEWKHPINGGLWAFHMNRAGARFIEFHAEQVKKKDWKPYRDYLKKFGHLDEVNWRVGQDFLNVIAKHPLPFECEVEILSDEWNWVHDSGPKKKVDAARQAEQDALFDKAKKAYAQAMNDPRIKVVHFKARMKNEMPRYARMMGIECAS